MKKISRRQFIYADTACVTMAAASQCFGPFGSDICEAAGTGGIRGKVFKGDAPDKLWKWSREGFLYKKLTNDKVVCGICPNRCVLAPGDRSVCRSKVNLAGKLYSLAYGNPCAVNTDPIEKKPLFHMMPGSRSYSVATVGCNFRCRFCQNAEIAQFPNDRNGSITGSPSGPEEIVADAAAHQCATIAYTYTEPTIYFEYAYETAKLAHAQRIKNVFVTNGYMTTEALEMISPYLDGANVDLKAFTEDFYRRQCGGELEPVKKTLEYLAHETNVWVELTTLLIPGLNDSDAEIDSMTSWVVDRLGDADGAVASSDAAVALAKRVEHSYSLAFAQAFAARLHQSRRDVGAVDLGRLGGVAGEVGTGR